MTKTQPATFSRPLLSPSIAYRGEAGTGGEDTDDHGHAEVALGTDAPSIPRT